MYRTDIRKTALNEIRDYGVTAINIRNGVCRNPGAITLLESLRASAREEWWPSLRRLRDAHYRAVNILRFTSCGSALLSGAEDSGAAV